MTDNFAKPPLPVKKQLELLESRGMQIGDRAIAEKTLRYCNYYRISGYAIHFEIFDNNRKRTHRFKRGTTFEKVFEIYEFDDRLRTIVFDYLGHIEIAIRSLLCHVIALETSNPHWYLDRQLFLSSFTVKRNVRSSCGYENFIDDIKREIRRSKEIFIESYNEKYSDPELPPAWMLVEILPMGSWSKLYQNLLDSSLKKKIADFFGQSAQRFESWLHALSVLRNHCAHHSRVWNRSFHISPSLVRAHKKMLKRNSELATYNYTKLATFLISMNRMLETINRDTQFKMEMKSLFETFPGVPIEKMGLNDKIKQELGYA